MLSVTHSLVSLPLALYLQHPVTIFLAAVVLHFLADTILHWNIFYDEYKRYPYAAVGFDVATGGIAAYLLVGTSLPPIAALAAVIGGNAPDILDGIWSFIQSTRYRWLLAWLQPYFTFHDRLQHETYNKRVGLVTQVGLVALAVTLVLTA